LRNFPGPNTRILVIYKINDRLHRPICDENKLYGKNPPVSVPGSNDPSFISEKQITDLIAPTQSDTKKYCTDTKDDDSFFDGFLPPPDNVTSSPSLKNYPFRPPVTQRIQ